MREKKMTKENQKRSPPDSIQSICLELLKNVKPKLRDRKSLIVKFPSKDEDALVVDLQTKFVPRDEIGESIIGGTH